MAKRRELIRENVVRIIKFIMVKKIKVLMFKHTPCFIYFNGTAFVFVKSNNTHCITKFNNGKMKYVVNKIPETKVKITANNVCF